jgi:hypothetical protein
VPQPSAPTGVGPSPDDVSRIARARAAAHAETTAFLAAYDAARFPPPVCAALLRAWHALASVEALLRGDAPQSAASFLESLTQAPPYLPAPLGDVPAAFAAQVAACATSEPWSAAAGPNDRDFDAHRRALLRGLRTVDRRVRRVPGLGIRWRRLLWAGGGLVALALSVTAIAFALYKPRWRVSYFANDSLVGTPARVVRLMDADDDWGPGGPGMGIPTDHFSARMETCLRLDRAAAIAFVVGSDDGSRLFVDDKLVIDAWNDQAYTTRQQSVPLEKGTHAIRLEYYERSGNARVTITGRVEGFSADFDSLLRLPADGSPVCR